jgi:ketosteroid isomerase-like protein
MDDVARSNLDAARRYLAAVEGGAQGAALAEFYTPDAIQEEFPNRLTPAGARRDLTAVLDAAERGRRVMAAQRYEVRGAVANGDRVALEVAWTGTLAMAVGSLPAGGTMRARFGVFLEFRDGKIAAQRNYDCIEPW